MFTTNKDFMEEHHTLSPSEAAGGGTDGIYLEKVFCTQTSSEEHAACETYISRNADDIVASAFLLLGVVFVLLCIQNRERFLGFLKTRIQRQCFVAFILGTIFSALVLWVCFSKNIHGLTFMCCSYIKIELDPIYWYHSSPFSFLLFLLSFLTGICGFLGMFWHEQIANLYSCTIKRLISWVRSGN